MSKLLLLLGVASVATSLFGAGTSGGTLLGSEPDGMAIDFTAATPNMLIRDAGVTLNYSGRPFSQGPLGDAGKLSFTGASLRMKYNSSGTLENSGHNVHLRSETIGGTGYNLDFSTINANATTAPDGTLTADKLETNTTLSRGHQTYQNGGFTVKIGQQYRFSVYAKKADYDFAWLDLYEGANIPTYFNLNTGAVATVGAGVTGSIENIGNGWYRCTAIKTATTTSVTATMGFCAADNTFTFATAAAAGLGNYFWGAQFNHLPCSDTTYYPTVASAYFGPRIDFNPATLAARGLLVEEARTNLITRSQELDNGRWTPVTASISANAVAAPDGTTTADKIVEDSSTGVHYLSDTTASSLSSIGGVGTYSVYVKAAGRTWAKIAPYDETAAVSRGAYINLSTGAVGTVLNGATVTTEDVGNSWWRVKVFYATWGSGRIFMGVNLASADNTESYAGDGSSGVYAWGMQWEQASFATSYIPTTSASVTRAQDVATMALSLLPFSATVGTVIAQEQVGALDPLNALAWSMTDGTNNERFLVYLDGSASATPKFFVMDGGAGQADITSGVLTKNTTFKIGSAWAANDFAHVLNGGSVGTDASATIPTPTDLTIGGQSFGTNLGQIWVEKFTYIPLRKSNANLQTLTT